MSSESTAEAGQDQAESQQQEAAGEADRRERRERAGRRFQIEIFEAWCKSCGICAAFCPRKCITMTEAGVPVVDGAQRCTGCGWCEIHCPDFAISVRVLAAVKTIGP